MTEYYACKEYNFYGDAIEIAQLFKDRPHFFFMDSSSHSSSDGRFSYIGCDPFYVFQSTDNNSIPQLKKLFKQYSQVKNKELPFFHSGIVGYLSYDFGFHLEDITRRINDDLFLPECIFGFYDSVIAIDHIANKLYVVATGLPEKSKHFMSKKAHCRIQDIIHTLSKWKKNTPCLLDNINCVSGNAHNDIPLVGNFTEQEYKNAVKKALDYIAAGDIYQVNLSQRFIFDYADTLRPEPFGIYTDLRKLSPSSFSGYLDCGDFNILSSSPERFLCLRDRELQTRPMKGTRPRGRTSFEDKQFKEDLIKSKKDKAELLMITDLQRNDLGRVCEYGSVRVAQMRTLEEYSTVFQTTSTVIGQLKKDMNCFDALAACFPGGSITGCPKIRSMEVIEELETVRRGIYTGILGYISFSGDMDFNILIRTLLAKEKKVYFHTGSGIVADSVPKKEYQETLVKSYAMTQCLAGMQRLRVSV